MKKIFLPLICFVVLPLCINAQDILGNVSISPDTNVTTGMELTAVYEGNGHVNIVWNRDGIPIPGADSEKYTPDKAGTYTVTISTSYSIKTSEPVEVAFRFKDRAFELGLFNVSAGVANDFLTSSELFRDTLVIDIDKLGDGLRMNLALAISPLYFSYNKDNEWGFGLSTGMDAMGILGLSGNLLNFKQAVDDKSDISGAVFATIGLNGFYTYKGFKIKVKPAFYYPIFYIKPDISYTNKTTTETVLKLTFDIDIYTAFPLGDDEGESTGFTLKNLSAKTGFDLSAGVEYPLSKELGITDKFNFLDFDVGVDFESIPIVPSSMLDYMRVSGQIGGDEPLDFSEGFDDMDSFFNIEDTTYGRNKILVLRPFKMLTWADWRPLPGSRLVTVIPSFGFAINPLYVKPFSVEGGIKARLNLINMFILTGGINYEDRFWKNSIDLALNFRAFELDLGVDMRSQNFGKSWSGGGVGANFGLKFGW